MVTNNSATSGGAVGASSALAMLAGLSVFGYGLVVVPTSALGGAWIAAIGLALFAAGFVATVWGGDRLRLSAAGRRRLSLALGALAALLAVAFVAVNFASFDSGGVETSG